MTSAEPVDKRTLDAAQWSMATHRTFVRFTDSVPDAAIRGNRLYSWQPMSPIVPDKRH